MGLGRSLPFMPEAQTLLTVVQTTVLGKPAPIAAWRAGACPRFALSTLPKNTSCTVAGSTPAFWSAARLQNAHTQTVLLLNPKTYYPHKRCRHSQDYSWGQTQKHVVLLSSKDFAIPKIQRSLSRVFCSCNNYQLENCGIDPSMYLEWQLILTWLQWGWRVIHSNCPSVSLQHPLCTHLQIQHSLKPYSAFWSLSLQTKKRCTRETDKPNQFFCFLFFFFWQCQI